MTSCLYSPISSHSEPLDLALVKPSEHPHPIVIENLYLRKKIRLSQLNLCLVYSMNAYEVRIKGNSNEILNLLTSTFSKGGVSSCGLSQFALLLGTFADDQLLFVIYGLINDTKKMQLRALELCVFDQPIVSLLWQAQTDECEDSACTAAFQKYWTRMQTSSDEIHFPLLLKKRQKQPETTIRLSQPPRSSSSLSTLQSSQSSLESSNGSNLTELQRKNRNQIKYAIKRLLEKHSIHSKHPDYRATHKLIYENCKFRLRKELERNASIEDSVIWKAVQREYQRNQDLVNTSH